LFHARASATLRLARRATFRGGVLLLLAGCAPEPGRPGSGETSTDGSPDPLSAIDDSGRNIRLGQPAVRIVSLLPAATETLLALGAGDRLIARTDYDHDARLAALPSVGGGLTPSLELLASLQPDLVLTWEEAGTARTRPRLEALGIPVFALQTRDTADIFHNIERFGRLTALEGAADSLASAIRAELAEITASVPPGEAPTVVYLIGLDPPMIAGPNLFIGQLLEVAGGRNAFPELRVPSPQMSLEEILKRQPDVVLVPSAGERDQLIARLKGAPGWRELMASGGTRLEIVSADVLHRPGPGVVHAARELRRVIHGGAYDP